MPGSLHFLDGQSRDHIVGWLREALHGRTSVPLEYRDQPVSAAISAAAPALSDLTRNDLAAAAILLLAELKKGRHPHSYISALLRLVTDLDLRSSAVPILRDLAKSIPALKDRLGWESCSDILIAQLNLRDLQDEAYWRRIWECNKRCFSPVTLAALFDLDPQSALSFLPELPNSADLGDLVALTLDHSADAYQGHERSQFRRAASAIAERCKSHIRQAIKTWHEETAPSSLSAGRDLSLLHTALGPPPQGFIRSSSKLVNETAA